MKPNPFKRTLRQIGRRRCFIGAFPDGQSGRGKAAPGRRHRLVDQTFEALATIRH